jgi:hypothetical protein
MLKIYRSARESYIVIKTVPSNINHSSLVILLTLAWEKIEPELVWHSLTYIEGRSTTNRPPEDIQNIFRKKLDDPFFDIDVERYIANIEKLFIPKKTTI